MKDVNLEKSTMKSSIMFRMVSFCSSVTTCQLSVRIFVRALAQKTKALGFLVLNITCESCAIAEGKIVTLV
jgi:hypothetical protein